MSLCDSKPLDLTVRIKQFPQNANGSSSSSCDCADEDNIANTPHRCQQCDFVPASASQLAQHVRVNHAAIQAYICRICGYKGYSLRGIRSHLRQLLL
ncbi:unnamed protein product [Gongylonema pulchrum]|uniref:C2H2-type domain-containing protein n=1 Tax=Gongylonema pulchrum TaxID=637853 RepID=A0A183D7F7_9BILA|nr:unnamed protein product [Gongylonema pulchrum]